MSLNDVGIYLRDGPFSSDIGIVNLPPIKGNHWVLYVNESFFDSYGCAHPNTLSSFSIKRMEYCLYSEYKIQRLASKRDSYGANYLLYIIYLTKSIGLDFESAVLNLYYQMIQ